MLRNISLWWRNLIGTKGETRTVAYGTENMIQASAAIFKRLLEPLKQMVLGTELDWEEAKRIILLGGPCKMPVVRLHLQYFQKRK